MVDNDASIFIIGSIGYKNARQSNVTPVYKLNTQSYDITAIQTVGAVPGWIHRHTAVLSENGMDIEVRIMVDGVLVRFVDDSDHVTVIVEGLLSSDQLNTIVDEFVDKLERIENCSCELRRIV